MKNLSKFFLNKKKSNNELNTFFEKLCNINSKEKTARDNLSPKQRQALKIFGKTTIWL